MAVYKCIHCLKDFDNITEDHVFPESWYPISTPSNLEKWKAPACLSCNNKLGHIENELMITMGLCVDPSDIRAKGISERALNALKESRGRNERDRQFRKGKFLKTVKSIFYISPTAKGIHPDFGPHLSRQNQIQLPGVPLSAKFLKQLSDKITRGLYYVLMNKYVDKNYVVDVIPPTLYPEAYDGLLAKYGTKINQGPGFEILEGQVSDDPLGFVCKVTIWGKLQIRSSIMKKENNFAKIFRKIQRLI